MGKLTAAQLQILQHSLGVDEYGRGEMYRNSFCAGGKDEDVCRELIALGYMQQHQTTEMYPYFNCSVTDSGKAAMRAESPKPPKLTRGQRLNRLQTPEAKKELLRRWNEWKFSR
jgi:hypothetical protein